MQKFKKQDIVEANVKEEANLNDKLLRHLFDNTGEAFARFSLTSVRYQNIPGTGN